MRILSWHSKGSGILKENMQSKNLKYITIGITYITCIYSDPTDRSVFHNVVVSHLRQGVAVQTVCEDRAVELVLESEHFSIEVQLIDMRLS